jgi:hypothetical protein
MPEDARQYWFSRRSTNGGGARQMRTRALFVRFGYTLQTIKEPIPFGALKKKAQNKVTA